MAFTFKFGEQNVVPKGTVLFEQNEPVSCICVVLKGNIQAITEAVKYNIAKGGFVCIPDLFAGTCTSGYIASEDSSVFPIPITDRESLRKFLQEKKDYRSLIIASLCKNFHELKKAYDDYYRVAGNLFDVLGEGYLNYKNICRTIGTVASDLFKLENLEAFEPESEVDEEGFPYFEDLTRLPLETSKDFFSKAGENIVMMHIEKMSAAVTEIVKNLGEICPYVSELQFSLYNDGGQCLISFVADALALMDKGGANTFEAMDLMDELTKAFKDSDVVLAANMATPPTHDAKRLEEAGKGKKVEKSGSDKATDESNYRSLKSSFKQILDFAPIDKELYTEMSSLTEKFVVLHDKLSADDDIRMLRKKISEAFYKVYKEVFLRSLTTKTLPLAVKLFLNFGFMDERLLTKDQVIGLCNADLETVAKYHCNMYTIPQWLTLVYDGKKEPSKNEFDMEYTDMLRDRKKRGDIDEKREKELLASADAKLESEIQSLFRYNHRILHGQPTIFVPMLYADELSGDLGRMLVTKDKMGQAIEKVRSIDYSVFYRELLYQNKELKIDREYENKEVVPDIILFPCYGTNSVMWQDISAKRRNSPGRFLFPTLVEGSLEDLVVKACGRFRWELCRTMQGTAWNNIQVKSLTSEYSDYIQFYRRNKDLSEEKKNKIKLQITKGRNNTREIFLIDYEQWIKSESKGGIRLNKVAREMLAKYCPFERTIRESLASQPTFAEAMARFNRENQKKTREVELRLHALKAAGITIPPELNDTFSFYRDL